MTGHFNARVVTTVYKRGTLMVPSCCHCNPNMNNPDTGRYRSSLKNTEHDSSGTPLGWQQLARCTFPPRLLGSPLDSTHHLRTHRLGCPVQPEPTHPWCFNSTAAAVETHAASSGGSTACRRLSSRTDRRYWRRFCRIGVRRATQAVYGEVSIRAWSKQLGMPRPGLPQHEPVEHL